MLGIRAEDKNEWERRVPLTPTHVADLVRDQGVDVTVEPSTVRAFPDAEYRKAGARIDADLSRCSLIVGVKEVPIDRLIAEKAYMIFSHTTKGQAYNMPTLQRMLDLPCSLIDYEQVEDAQGRRLIFFGQHAGFAGMIDGLWALGKRLELDGIPTALAKLQPTHAYDGLEAARAAVTEVGAQIAERGLPESVTPLVCGFAGTGNVSRGAQEIFDLLPSVTIAPDQLADLHRGDTRNDVLYKCVFDLDQRFVHRDGGPVRLDELGRHPERFENGMLRYLPHIDMLVNGMFWVAELPRMLTLSDLATGRSDGSLAGLRVIADIACDIDGAIEATVRATTPDAPVFVYDADNRTTRDGFEGNGPVILAVDNLPAELPRESSSDFGDTLVGFVPELVRCDWSRPLSDLALCPELARAVIAHRGDLAPAFSYLTQNLNEQLDGA